jgi:hypothetical protein
MKMVIRLSGPYDPLKREMKGDGGYDDAVRMEV